MTDIPQEVQKAVEEYAGIQTALKALYDERDRTFATIFSWMDLQKAKRLVVGNHTVTIPVKRAYDTDKFQSRFGESEFADCMEPEHEETRIVKAKVDGRKVKPMWEMGEDITSELEQCLLPQRPEIRISTR